MGSTSASGGIDGGITAREANNGNGYACLAATDTVGEAQLASGADRQLGQHSAFHLTSNRVGRHARAGMCNRNFLGAYGRSVRWELVQHLWARRCADVYPQPVRGAIWCCRAALVRPMDFAL